MLKSISVNDAVSCFYTFLWRCFEECVPKYTPRVRSCAGWQTPYLKYLKNNKNRLFKKYKRSGTLLSYAQYAEARYQYLKCNKNCYAEYLRKIRCNIRTQPKKFFDFVNSKRKSSGFPATLKHNNKTSANDEESAELFAEFFSSVYSTETFDASCLNADIPQLSTCISIPAIDELTVDAYLQSVKLSHQVGPDNVPSCIVKNCADILCVPLALLFNLSLASGIFPDLWKESFIKPLHKNGPKTCVSNYRGIAKLSVIPKVFEHIIADQLSCLLNLVLSTMQHGFTRKRSTVTNLVEFTSLVSDGFALGMQTDVLYTDFTKAFDRLCQALICIKLDKIGLAPSLVKWISSYLSNRFQRVLFKSIKSRRFSVTSGVPQGSHLGPLLFNIFINDLPTVIKHCAVFMFADDVKICCSYKDPASQTFMQRDIDALSEWCRLNCLSLNLTKCKVMSYSWKTVIPSNYSIDGHDLETVSEYRDLGVIMDPRLRFDRHINSIVSKARLMLGFIKRWSKEFKDPYVTKLLYTALVRPILEYASPVWDPSYTVYMDIIESVQKQFLLFALRCLPWDPALRLPPYEARLKLLHLPTLRSRRAALNVSFLLKLLQGEIDSSSLLGRVEFAVPRRVQRHFEPIYLKTCTVNYLEFNAFRSICKDFNRYYFLFSFNGAPDQVKSRIVQYLNC